MIDEKKIEEAAKKHSAKASGDYIAATEAEEGFKAGAHWALQEFLKGLWHDASDVPKRDKPNIIVQYKDKSFAWVDTNFMFGMRSLKLQSYADVWKEYIEFLNVRRWLYMDDLLSKQKGSNEQ